MRAKTGILLYIATCLFLGQAAWAITLTGYTTPDPAVVAQEPAPQMPGYRSWSTALSTQPLTVGRNTDFEAAWNTVLPGEWNPTGWTLSFSAAPLDAVLNVSTYRAYNSATSSDAGAEIRINWTPTADQQNLKWIQAIHTNSGRSGLPYYLDIFNLRPPDYQAPVYPWYYSDYHFYDMPGRGYTTGQHVFWTAYLYLADVNRTAKSVTIYEGLSWGFTIDSEPVPEPGGMLVLASGAGGLAVLVRRRRE